MTTKIKNFTFSLPTELVEQFKGYVKEEYIPSLNAGIKKALEEFIKKIEREKFQREMEEASKDLLFIKDLEDSMKSFEFSDREIEGTLTEW